jgi:peroxiredoxin
MKKTAFIAWGFTVLTSGPAEGRAPQLVLAETAEEAQPLGAGGAVPEANLKGPDGSRVSLQKETGGKPTILIFYRGGWCPYCSAHLGELQKAEKELVGLGYQILAISADRPSALRTTSEKLTLSYQLLSDEDMEASAAFGLAFRVGDETLARYKEYGIELTAKQGERYWLPVPAVYVVDRKGTIRFAHADPNYRERLPAAELLSTAREAAAP